MNKKILVVDDQLDIIKVLKAILESHNYTVISANDGEEALQIVKTNKPDLIIMDIMMPKLQGGDAVRILKSDVITKHIPVIFLTSVMSDMNPDEEKAINVDGQFYTAFSKSFKPERLLFEIKKLISTIKPPVDNKG
ncbi:MAG: response regulator [Candidatus Omnitrophica bacterium]|nr:response regulator [Candidatus Omnitrophota bacterium]